MERRISLSARLAVSAADKSMLYATSSPRCDPNALVVYPLAPAENDESEPLAPTAPLPRDLAWVAHPEIVNRVVWG